MKTFLILFRKVCLTESTLLNNTDDENYNFLLYDFAMNYSLDSLRTGYQEWKKKEQAQIDDDLLRELGYSEEDILLNQD